MDTEALNKAIVGRWFTSFWGKDGDLSVVDELTAPDVVLQYSSLPVRGHHAVKTFMAEFRGAFPDLNFCRIGALISDRDIVVVRWRANGTHTGPAYDDFNLGALPVASGRAIELSGHTAVRLDNAQIVEEAIWSTERKVNERMISAGLAA